MKTQRRIVLKLLIPNLVLFVLTAGILFFAVAQYRNLAEAEILGRNSFLTMEWQLLQNLKAETDRQLFQKDREIAELNERYAKLKLGGASSPELSRLEKELQKAESEREDLLSRIFSGTINTDSAGKEAPAVTPAVVVPASVLSVPRTGVPDVASALLKQRIRELELELSQSKAISPVPTVAVAVDVVPAGSPDYIPLILSSLRLSSLELEGASAPRIQDVKTRTLLRAIVVSPSIKANYPGLLEETDRFFESFAIRERLEGKKEAYAAITETVREIVGK